MSFAQANIAEIDVTDEVTDKFLRHALKVWAHGHDIADRDLPALVSAVLDFADSSMRDARFGRGANA